jgi:uncharacterized membrane protein
MAFVAIMNTFSACLSAHIPYHYLINQYGNPMAAIHLTWSLPIAMFCSELSNFIIRGLYARRVWLLSRGNGWLTGLICVLSLPNFVMCTTRARRLFNAEFAMNIAVEVAITGALCFYLFQSRTAFAKTNSVVNTLIKYAISTGLLVIIVSVIAMTLHWTLPMTNWAITFYLIQGKLYTNSYLSMLTTRETLRDFSEDAVSIHLSQMPSKEFIHVTSPSKCSPPTGQTTGVLVSHLSEPTTDDEGKTLS